MPTDLFIWAHRGASARAPENTLSAFRAAEAAGADGIELDVHLSRDGVLVVIHDDRVDRTTNGSGAVADLTASALQELDAGSWFSPEFRGERVPTLADVFAWAGDRSRINVEIKTAAAGEAVLELLRHFPGTRVLISSFDAALLEDLRRRDSCLPLAFLVDKKPWQPLLDRAAASGAEAFHPKRNLVTPHLIAACRKVGMAVNVWTVADPSEANRLRNMGVMGVFANDPERLRAGLE